MAAADVDTIDGRGTAQSGGGTACAFRQGVRVRTEIKCADKGVGLFDCIEQVPAHRSLIQPFDGETRPSVESASVSHEKRMHDPDGLTTLAIKGLTSLHV